MKEKLILHSKVKRNQPVRCRFYKADMDKHVAFLKAIRVERFFISIGTISQIFGLKWESGSVPWKTANWPRMENVPISGVIHSHVI